jgi:two-component system, sensor histidine kinase LadS
MLQVPLMCVLKRCLLLCALALCTLSAFAQPQAKGAVAEASAIKVLSTVVMLSPAQTTVNAVQTAPVSKWQNFDPATTYPLDERSALWIKLQLWVSSPATDWTVKLPKPFLDRIELHLPTPDGAWRVQVSGDNVAHRDWPVRGLHPQFALPVLSNGEHTVFLKVSNRVPANFTVQVLSAQDANADSLEHYIRSGLALIFFVCMTFVSVCLAMVYRDAAYGWYSLYTALTALTVAAYTGLANYLLWPEATHWPEVSIHVSLLVTLLAQMVFCYVTFEPQKLWAKFTPMLWLTASLTLVCIAALILPGDIRIQIAVFFFALLVNWMLILAMVCGRLLRGELSAKLWVLAYMPLASVIILASIDHFGMSTRSMVGYYWPTYALTFEIPILLLALILRAKARDAQMVVQRVHQQLDPLTGFILHRAYATHALPLWEHACTLDLDLAVAYVQVSQPSRSNTLLGGYGQVPRSERIVRLLRTVFRQDDVYAQLNNDVYAILMPGIALGDSLQNRLTRLVAQIHMLSQELQIDYPLRARIVACSNKSLPLQWPQVHKALLDRFSKDKGWEKRSIRYMAMRSDLQEDSEPDLSVFWAKALNVSAGQSG